MLQQKAHDYFPHNITVLIYAMGAVGLMCRMIPKHWASGKHPLALKMNETNKQTQNDPKSLQGLKCKVWSLMFAEESI